MRRVFVCLLFIPIVFCCKNKDSGVLAIWIENNSDKSSVIEVSTYLNDSMVDKRDITRDSIADRIRPFKIRLKKPTPDRDYRFKFILSSKEEASCTVYADSLKEPALLHVNYVEKIYKKGASFENVTLSSDSVYDKRFYCEAIYHPSRF